MPRATLAISLLCLGLSVSGCKKKELEAALAETQAKLAQTEQDLDSQRRANEQLRQQNQTLEERIAELQNEIKQLEAQIDDLAKKQGMTAKELAELRKEKAKREAELRVYQDLFAKLKELIDAGTIEVVVRDGRLTLKLANAILFDSGRVELKPEGEAAIGKLVPALKSVGDREFLVAGHTDNVPIKTARFKSNWELSTARAVTVVKHMVSQGYPATNVGAAGYGENDPVASNDTEEGKAQNRRIEIILMPKLGALPGLQKILGK